MADKEKKIDSVTGEPTPTTENSKDELKYTQEAFNKAMANKDREVSAKYEKQIKELKAQFATEKAELKTTYLAKGEERAKMSAEERAKADLKDREDALQAKEEALNAAKTKVAQAQALTATENELKEKDIPTKFAKLLVDIDPDIREQKINDFAATWKTQVETAVDKKVTGSGKTPQSGSTTVTGSVTLEQFRNMNMAEQSQLYLDDKETYNKLKGEL